jgi:cyclopropane fatty-acyl-phospholipid synthase-like methyltransferase
MPQEHGLEGVLRQQIAYYRARASSYDEAYRRIGQYDRGAAQNAAWKDELRIVHEMLDGLQLGEEVVEFGAGTGHWTERLIRKGCTVAALDAAPEALEIARRRVARLGAAATFEVVDLLGWRAPRAWDEAVACFFLEHIPDRRLDAFLREFAAAVRPGGTVFIVDGLHGIDGPEVETRELDGRRFTVVERRRSTEVLCAAFDRVGVSLEIQPSGTRFQYGVGFRRQS